MHNIIIKQHYYSFYNFNNNYCVIIYKKYYFSLRN